MLVHKEPNSVVGSASGYSKPEAVRRKGGLNRDDSGIFSASPSPLTPSRTLTAFPPPAIAKDTMSASKGQAAETTNSQDGSPVAVGGKSCLADLANVSLFYTISLCIIYHPGPCVRECVLCCLWRAERGERRGGRRGNHEWRHLVPHTPQQQLDCCAHR